MNGVIVLQYLTTFVIEALFPYKCT